MAENTLSTPVAFFVFNRPDTTRHVFEQIKKARPSTLLLIADGPRQERLEDMTNCREVRAIIEEIDWPCKILKNYSDINLGCKIRISSGLDWVFDQVEEAIILEDDCLPHPSFFPYCETLLEHYKNDERIMQISGCNFQDGIRRGNGSYYFSRYNHIWGWATWKRAWRYYDLSMSAYPEFLQQGTIENIWPDKRMQKFWLFNFQAAYEGKINTWDYQWSFAISIHSGLTILPGINLISNIGFDDRSTHTKYHGPDSKLDTFEIKELTHPEYVVHDEEADRYTFEKLHFLSLKQRIIRIVNRRIKVFLNAE